MGVMRIADWKVEHIYQRLVEAAENNERCPSNNDLAFLINASSTTAGSLSLRQLEEAGKIKVERFRRSRTVTILETGKSTFHVPEGRQALKGPPPPKRVPHRFKPLSEWGRSNPSPIPVDTTSLGIARNYLRRFFSNVFSASILVGESPGDRRTWADVQNMKYGLGIPDHGRGYTFISGLDDVFSAEQVVGLARKYGWRESAHVA